MVRAIRVPALVIALAASAAPASDAQGQSRPSLEPIAADRAGAAVTTTGIGRGHRVVTDNKDPDKLSFLPELDDEVLVVGVALRRPGVEVGAPAEAPTAELAAWAFPGSPHARVSGPKALAPAGLTAPLGSTKGPATAGPGPASLERTNADRSCPSPSAGGPPTGWASTAAPSRSTVTRGASSPSSRPADRLSAAPPWSSCSTAAAAAASSSSASRAGARSPTTPGSSPCSPPDSGTACSTAAGSARSGTRSAWSTRSISPSAREAVRPARPCRRTTWASWTASCGTSTRSSRSNADLRLGLLERSVVRRAARGRPLDPLRRRRLRGRRPDRDPHSGATGAHLRRRRDPRQPPAGVERGADRRAALDPLQILASPLLAPSFDAHLTTLGLAPGDFAARARPRSTSLRWPARGSGRDGAVLRFGMLGGVGHQYPNGANNPAGFSAAPEFWSLFRAHALP